MDVLDGFMHPYTGPFEARGRDYFADNVTAPTVHCADRCGGGMWQWEGSFDKSRSCHDHINGQLRAPSASMGEEEENEGSSCAPPITVTKTVMKIKT